MAGKSKKLSQMVFKAMGLFSGVQALNILCSVVRCKLVALWIGPAGVGLFAIWNNALDMLSMASNMGIRNSCVRNISANAASGDKINLSYIVTVVRRWSLWLGVGGALFTIAIAPFLSQITFGDNRHIWGFVALSVAVLLSVLMNGEQAILQGSSMLRQLAKASVCGTMAGLIVSIPLFYYLRINSVLPSVIAYSVFTALFAYVYRNKGCDKVNISNREVVRQGGEFIRLGIYMTIGGVLALVSNYALVAYLNWQGGAEEVGFYQASYTLANKYVGLVLTALGMEYYPRLSRVAQSRRLLGLFASQEINITFTVLTPIVMVMILLRHVVVQLLYSAEFEVICTCFIWMLVGMLLRASSWCLSFVIVARGDGHTYIVTEVVSVAIGLVLNVASYHYFGLDGMGLSFVIWYAVYNVIVGIVCIGKYKMRLHHSVWINVAVGVALSVACAVMVEYDSVASAIAVTAVLVVLNSVLICRQLRD